MVIREVPKPGGKKTEVRMVEVPTGYGVLPYQGGLLDQPHYLVDLFTFFFAGDRSAAFRKLSK